MQSICSNKLLDQVGSDDPWKVRINKNDVTKYLIEQGKLIAIESIETRNKLLLNIKGEN